MTSHELRGKGLRPHNRYGTGLLRTPDPLARSLNALRQAGAGGALWVVAPAPAHAFRTNLKQGGLARWLWDNCELRNTVGVGRIDFRQQYLQIYRCLPKPPGGALTGSAAAAQEGDSEG